MNELKLYSAMSRSGRLNYRAKIMLMAFLGTHIPLLAIIAFFVLSTTNDMTVVWSTLGVALVATLVGTGITLFVLNQLLQPVLLTSKTLRTYRQSREIVPLPTHYTDEAGTLMADASRTLTRLESSLIELEYSDGVTGLPNRAKFVGMLASQLAKGTELAVLVVRLGNLSRLVATYDQSSADGFIRVLASEIETAVGPAALLARVDTDAFAFVRPVADTEAMTASEFAADLLNRLTHPIGVEGIDVLPELRAGISLYPEDGADAGVLLDQSIAAAAMTEESKAVSFHSPKARDAARERFRMEQELRRAIKDDEFRLHFQPVADLRLGKAVGAEALIRWQHPEKGMIAPGLFIPAAERSGLIDEIGLWVMREACAQAGRWEAEALDPLKIAINVSARQFLDPRLIDHLAEALEDSRLSADRLEIELTETAAMVDYDHTKRTFTKLTDLGVSIAIDDFGTGYASMSYLRKLPFDKLKIDREFVSFVDTQASNQAICNAMIELAKGLKLRVLAEGTEREEEVRYLAERGCDLFQGYYFSRPVAAEAMAETLADLRIIAARTEPEEPLPLEARRA